MTVALGGDGTFWGHACVWASCSACHEAIAIGAWVESVERYEWEVHTGRFHVVAGQPSMEMYADVVVTIPGENYARYAIESVDFIKAWGKLHAECDAEKPPEGGS